MDASALTAAGLIASGVLCSEQASALAGITRSGIELAVWRRGGRAATATVQEWLARLPEEALPVCELDLRPAGCPPLLHAACDASGTPAGLLRQALVADISALAANFAQIAGCPTVRLRLEAVTGDACRRWHRDCVPLRLITTYRGPGTEWLVPKHGAAALAQPDEDVVASQRLEAFDVALFKGCGWPEQTHEGGIVHRSPRIAGQGVTRLVLVLNLPHGFVPGKLR